MPAKCKFHWIIMPWEQEKLDQQLACYSKPAANVIPAKGWGYKSRKSNKSKKRRSTRKQKSAL